MMFRRIAIVQGVEEAEPLFDTLVYVGSVLEILLTEAYCQELKNHHGKRYSS